MLLHFPCSSHVLPNQPILPQIITACLIDHFGLVGVPQRNFTVWRGLGSVAMIGGVIATHCGRNHDSRRKVDMSDHYRNHSTHQQNYLPVFERICILFQHELTKVRGSFFTPKRRHTGVQHYVQLRMPLYWVLGDARLISSDWIAYQKAS
ncbi:hypothetical protein BC938DRAFT_477929 [Jimgerdemannia flammicorona]|uniref:Uncharacterized protein n=1 Tax=Jimgerdemannia flammicorona TaxID=994334 RepID=A0A433QYP5_9FUNG|nr:hypothetical protein BC938DRAFT_477929 [Jimgerdemannia flammicorona]